MRFACRSRRIACSAAVLPIPTAPQSDQLAKRALREICLLRFLNHDNIILLKDVFLSQGERRPACRCGFYVCFVCLLGVCVYVCFVCVCLVCVCFVCILLVCICFVCICLVCLCLVCVCLACVCLMCVCLVRVCARENCMPRDAETR